jgi:hypothetical protein
VLFLADRTWVAPNRIAVLGAGLGANVAYATSGSVRPIPDR